MQPDFISRVVKITRGAVGRPAVGECGVPWLLLMKYATGGY